MNKYHKRQLFVLVIVLLYFEMGLISRYPQNEKN